MRSCICRGTRLRIFRRALQYQGEKKKEKKSANVSSSVLDARRGILITNRIVSLRFINVMCSFSLSLLAGIRFALLLSRLLARQPRYKFRERDARETLSTSLHAREKSTLCSPLLYRAKLGEIATRLDFEHLGTRN